MSEAIEAVYRHAPNMGEISGFGGEYEKVCQDMLEAGVKHINEQKLSGGDLALSGLVNVFGLCFPEDRPTEALSEAVVAASAGECTGAMHHAVMSRLAYIAANGWGKYCSELRKRESETSED